MENHERYKKEKKKDASTTTHRYHKQLRVLPAGAWRSWLFPSMIRFKRMVASLFVIWEENVFFFLSLFCEGTLACRQRRVDARATPFHNPPQPFCQTRSSKLGTKTPSISDTRIFHQTLTCRQRYTIF